MILQFLLNTPDSVYYYRKIGDYMKYKEVSIERVFSLPNYENIKIRLTAEVSEDEDLFSASMKILSDIETIKKIYIKIKDIRKLLDDIRSWSLHNIDCNITRIEKRIMSLTEDLREIQEKLKYDDSVLATFGENRLRLIEKKENIIKTLKELETQKKELSELKKKAEENLNWIEKKLDSLLCEKTDLKKAEKEIKELIEKLENVKKELENALEKHF